MVKKLISIFLTVLICISAFCTVGVTAESTEYTEGYYTYIVENGEATIIRADYDNLADEVVIPATLGGYPVTAIGDEAFTMCMFVTEFTVPDGVKSIGFKAFEWCDGLTAITLPDSVTYIGPSAFSGCMSLEAITIPKGVTAIARDTFYDCESLRSVTFHAGITTIGGGAFRGCSSLTTISLPANITSIGYNAFTSTGMYNDWYESDKKALYINKYLVNVRSDIISGSYTVTSDTKVIADSVFTSCNELTSVKLPSSVVAVGSAAFYNCAKLTTVNILGSIPEIKADTFKACPLLKTVSLPASVTAIGENAFLGCSVLKTLTLPDAVTTIGAKAFFECAALTSVNLPDGLTAIGDNAFTGCVKLTSISIPEKITKIGTDMLRDCVALSSVLLSDNITTIGNNAFTNTAYYNNDDNWEDNVLYIGNHLIDVKKGTYKDEFDLDMSYGLVEGEYTVKSGTVTIAQSAFLDCINLTDIILPDGLENINTSAFANCKSLETVTLPYTVKSIPASAFSLCKNLDTIYYNGTRAQFRALRIGSDNEYFTADKVVYTNMSDPELYTYTIENGAATVTGIDAAASGGIQIPDELGGLPVTAISDYAFYWRKEITNVVIPDSVTTIGAYAFSNCTSLTGVSLPEGIDTLSEGIFYGCTSLSRFVIPDTVTTINGKAFYGCTGLQGISFSENLESIGEYAFYNCSSLTSVSVPDSVDAIGNAAFAMCENLKSATLPDEVDSLGGAVFYCCRNLTSVNLPDNITAIGEAMFYGCGSLENITIPENVSDIGEGAFYYCSAITEIELPTSVTKVREYAFDGCSSLATVSYNGTIEDLDNISVGSCNLPFENAEKIVPLIIVFKNFDGTIIDTQTLFAGTTIVPPESPIRESTEQYSYTFSGWEGYTADMVATEDTTFTATYTETLNRYTYKFIDNNGTVVAEDTIDYGTEIPFPGVIPTKPQDLEYTYSFKGWSGYSFGMTITEDSTFTAEFIPTLNRFRGTLSGGEVTITAVDTSMLGDITIPSTLCGYPVAAIGNSAFADCKNIKTISIPNSITSIGDGAFSGCTSLVNISIPSSVKHLGQEAFSGCYSLAKITLPANITVISDYTFSGCTALKDITISTKTSSIGKGAFYGCDALETVYFGENSDVFKKINTNPTDNECFTDATVIYGYCVITFKNYDDTVFATYDLAYGDVITAPETNPIREKDAQYTYSFSGWEDFTENISATENMSFTARYKETVNQYTYTFTDEDGTVLKTETADYGTIITAPENPEKEGTAEHTYLFLGWKDYSDNMILKQDISFVAIYTQSTNSYLCTFADYDGTIIEQKILDYGTVIVPPENPSRESTAQYTYEFLCWNGFTDGLTVTGPVTFTATYIETVNQYTYTFVDEDGDILKEGTVDYGTVIVPPENPTKEATAQYTYIFSGWNEYTDGMAVTNDVTFTATYTKTVNQYTYTFIDDDGTVLKTVTADYGTLVTPPTVEHEDYLELEWHGFLDGMILTEDMEFTAIYTYNRVIVDVETIDGEYHINVHGAEGNPVVFVAFYQGTKFADVKSAVYTSDGVTLGSDKAYDNVKIMVWDSYSTLKPIADVTIK